MVYRHTCSIKLHLTRHFNHIKAIVYHHVNLHNFDWAITMAYVCVRSTFNFGRPLLNSVCWGKYKTDSYQPQIRKSYWVTEWINNLPSYTSKYSWFVFDSSFFFRYPIRIFQVYWLTPPHQFVMKCAPLCDMIYDKTGGWLSYSLAPVWFEWYYW